MIARRVPSRRRLAVAIFGPGVTRSKYTVPPLTATRRSAWDLAIDQVGHASGPSTRWLSRRRRHPDPLPATGSKDARRGKFGDPRAPGPRAAGGAAAIGRDGLRKTALAKWRGRAIGRGVDVDGDNTIDLRATGIV